MIDEAEQIVYHVIHYGWRSKEHQAVTCLPSITRERKRESSPGSDSQLPSPTCLPVQPLSLTNWQISFGRYIQTTNSPLSSIIETAGWTKAERQCVNFWGHCVASQEDVVPKHIFVVWWDLFHGSPVWQQTYNNGYPHSHTTSSLMVARGNTVLWSTKKIHYFMGGCLVPEFLPGH